MSAAAKKTKLNADVMQAVRSKGFDTLVANTIAQIATRLYDDEHMLRDVHNALRNKYTNYLDVYSAVKPVLSKCADSSTSVKI